MDKVMGLYEDVVGPRFKKMISEFEYALKQMKDENWAQISGRVIRRAWSLSYAKGFFSWAGKTSVKIWNWARKKKEAYSADFNGEKSRDLELAKEKLEQGKEWALETGRAAQEMITDKEKRDEAVGKAKEFIQGVKEGAKETALNLKETVSNLSGSGRKQVFAESLLYGLTFMGSFLVLGGGTDLEGGAPDMDMMAGRMINSRSGLKYHRNILSHTIVLALGVEFFLRVLFSISAEIHRYLPGEHDPLWDEFRRIGENVEKYMVSGAYFGIGMHLLKDSNLWQNGFASRTKAFVGLPAMADNAHQAVLGANGVFAGVLSAAVLQEKADNK